MLTIGFACKPVLSSGEMIPPFPPQEESQKRQLSSEESLEIMTRMLFHEQSTYTLLLEMSEPAIVAGESYQWIRWFDGLKESMSLLVEGMMSS